MLILKEENSYLKGTKHTLPKKIVDLYHNIILKYPQFSANGGYRKADHVLQNNGVVTMEWLKGMKSFFNKHVDTNDIDFVLGGGIVVKTFVNNKLEQLTAATPKTRKSHSNSPVKPLTPADNLSGHRGEKSSTALSMVNSLMTNVMPNLNSSFEKEIKGRTIIITESQLNILKENFNSNNKINNLTNLFNSHYQNGTGFDIGDIPKTILNKFPIFQNENIIYSENIVEHIYAGAEKTRDIKTIKSWSLDIETADSFSKKYKNGKIFELSPKQFKLNFPNFASMDIIYDYIIKNNLNNKKINNYVSESEIVVLNDINSSIFSLKENFNSKLIEINPEKYIYHKSNPKFRDEILKNGLQPKGKSEAWLSDTKIDGNVIFATNSSDKSEWFDSTYDDDIYKIDTTNLKNKWFLDPNFIWEDEPKHIITFNNIPLTSIELIYSGTGNSDF